MAPRSSAARTWKVRVRNERGVRRCVTGVIRRCHGFRSIFDQSSRVERRLPRARPRYRAAMSAIGYALASEDWPGSELVRLARRAEESGFEFASISDHFHPWIDAQGQSPFVWSVIGAIAEATERLRLGTGVTCPTMRIHPALVAQAAATCAELMPGRFFLGVGTGENLNEHILGDPWPPYTIRRQMLEEAVEIIRLLWQGGIRSYQGHYYTVANAQVYTLPDEPSPIIFAASGPRSAKMAGRLGDGIIGISPDAELLKAFDASGGSGKPRYGQATVCWAESKEEARHIAH